MPSPLSWYTFARLRLLFSEQEAETSLVSATVFKSLVAASYVDESREDAARAADAFEEAGKGASHEKSAGGASFVQRDQRSVAPVGRQPRPHDGRAGHVRCHVRPEAGRRRLPRSASGYCRPRRGLLAPLLSAAMVSIAIQK